MPSRQWCNTAGSCSSNSVPTTLLPTVAKPNAPSSPPNWRNKSSCGKPPHQEKHTAKHRVAAHRHLHAVPRPRKIGLRAIVFRQSHRLQAQANQSQKIKLLKRKTRGGQRVLLVFIVRIQKGNQLGLALHCAPVSRGETLGVQPKHPLHISLRTSFTSSGFHMSAN